MKKAILFVWCNLLFIAYFAQINLPIKLVSTPVALQQVINGMQNDFAGNLGDISTTMPQCTDYISNIKWPEAESNTISIYTKTENEAKTNSNSSWLSTILNTEDYKKATKQFRKVYQQINGASITYKGKKYTLNAKYDAPDESVGFSTILFECGDKTKLQVLVEINSENLNWKVNLNIYEVTKAEE